MQDVTFSCDSATGDLYRDFQLVGKLITGSNGAWLELVQAANKVPELQRALDLAVRERDELLGALAGMYRIRGEVVTTEEGQADHEAVVKRAENILLRFVEKGKL